MPERIPKCASCLAAEAHLFAYSRAAIMQSDGVILRSTDWPPVNFNCSAYCNMYCYFPIWRSLFNCWKSWL